MCHQQQPRLFLRDLPKAGAVKIEEFADAALGGFNAAVYTVGRQADKIPRYLSQEFLEPELFLQT